MYTKAQEARLTAESPVTYDRAVELSAELGQTVKSIISKLGYMNLEYIKKEVPAKKVAETTKAELVTQIEQATGDLDLSGLVGATRPALVALRDFITA